MFYNISKRMVSTVLIAIMLLTGFTSCASGQHSAEMVSENTTSYMETVVETEKRDTRFDDVDFKGKDFRVYSSVDTTDATNANALIEGTNELNGDIVNDAVYNRNQYVMDLLNIKLVFNEADWTYDTAEAEVRKLVMAGTDAYDLIINDVRAFASASVEGLFQNVADVENFDYTQKYWYTALMDDLQLIPGYSYIMAGDYFMDVIASCHALFYNKKIVEGHYNDENYIYNLVLDEKWTYDKMSQIVQDTYVDLNGDGKPNEGDQFGFTVHGTWGAAIPFVGSSGTKFIDRSSGIPKLSFNDERAVTYIEALNDIFWNTGTLNSIKENADMALGLRNLFASGLSVIIGYNRLGDLMKMRDIDFGIGIIPYPKLKETDKYVTSMHDTTEVGVIPVTCTDMNYITTVIEVLNRETSVMLMPEYYETALKVKYTTDEISATMIDLIHDSFGSSFPLAYDNALGGVMLHSFTDPMGKKSTDFASTYAKLEPAAVASLNKMIENIKTNNNIE